MAVAAALGISLWLSALNVQYRDVSYITPFLAQIWFYATPIVYPLTLIPTPWRDWAGLNPMVAVIEGFRWSLLGAPPPSLTLVSLSIAVILTLLVSGAYAFRRMEKSFADIV